MQLRFERLGGVAILVAFPAEDKRAAIEFREARAELGLPPQIEDDVAVRERDLAVIPEPVDHCSSVHVKPKIRATTSRRTHVACRRPNFFERIVAGFISLQKHQPAKTATKRSHKTSRRG